jgi:predicted anti-sigma-YlaC factor YlaD
MSAVRKRPTPAHCRIAPAHWSQFLEGEFSSAECRRCEAHLKACADCRAALKDVRQAVGACQTAGRKAVPVAVKAQARQRARALLSRQRG